MASPLDTLIRATGDPSKAAGSVLPARLPPLRARISASMKTVYDVFAGTAAAAPDHAFLCAPPAPPRAYLPVGGEHAYAQPLDLGGRAAARRVRRGRLRPRPPRGPV